MPQFSLQDLFLHITEKALTKTTEDIYSALLDLSVFM